MENRFNMVKDTCLRPAGVAAQEPRTPGLESPRRAALGLVLLYAHNIGTYK